MSLASRWKSRTQRVDPQPAPIPWTLPLASEISTSDFVDFAYQILVGHRADDFGRAHHTRLIDTGSKSRKQFVYELTQTPDFKAGIPDVNQIDENDFVNLTYQVLLGRKPNPEELVGNAGHIKSNRISRSELMRKLFYSNEFLNNTWVAKDFWFILFRARHHVAAQLPKARRIVDLGGSCGDRPEGALIVYGYPYEFESLSIVELPREERFEDYTEICGDYAEQIDTPQGPVKYVFNSMTNLSAFADESTDLVYAGQSIEHVTQEEAIVVLREVHRILMPGGHFCFDTPNRALTKLASESYIVDDHKIEYTHPQMVEMLEGNGYAIRDAKGITLMDRSVREGRFIAEEAMNRDRMYTDIENCFLLYYMAEKV